MSGFGRPPPIRAMNLTKERDVTCNSCGSDTQELYQDDESSNMYCEACFDYIMGSREEARHRQIGIDRGNLIGRPAPDDMF